MRWYLRSKIHKATVTEANVDYTGSITIDRELIEKAGFHKGEKVAVWDITNGERLETYVIEGKRNLGTICMNGATAKKIKKGDNIIIAGFELSDNYIEPRIVLVNEENKFVRYLK
ncbi:aspartate 1-decarboxylase [Candidatus Woesearchaeota archaeon]|nr:aspartate 1-decarboxylase [Candidatus Woesearchaeota archaeon]